MVFKKVISPVQKILMTKGVCPGCGRPLTKKVKREKYKGDLEKITCKCRRVYIFNKKTQEYRRAQFNEV
jgi:hypothetical protein